MTSTSGRAPDENSSTDTPSFVRSLTSRTSLITTVAIAGVMLAGGAAIAANIGILSAADSSDIGELAATELVAIPAATETTSTTATTSTTTPAVGTTSDYVVDDAGTVSLMASDTGLTLAAATATDGWTPALSQSEPTSLTVVFTNGARTVVFTATLADGAIVADVTEPIVVTGAVPNGPITIPTAPSYDDSDDDDSYEDDEDDDEDDEDEDDDDSYEDDDEDEDEEHEYEGADDDD